VFDFLKGAATGQNTGFTPEYMSSARGEAIDNAGRTQREYQRVATQGPGAKRITGGVTSGAQQRLQERAIGQGLTLRSEALRDLGLRNEILKKQEQWQGVQGMQDFLNSERNQANWLYQNPTMNQYNADVATNEAIRQWKSNQIMSWKSIG
jgi:hypothetical protein